MAAYQHWLQFVLVTELESFTRKIKLKRASELRTFLLKLSGFYFFWILSSHILSHKFLFYSKIWAFFYHTFLVTVTHITTVFLNLFNYEFVYNYRQLALIGTPGIYIYNTCVGLGLTYMFWALIISYPGNLKSKIAVLIMGTLTLLITNGIRMFILVTGIKFNLDINPIEIHDLFNNVIYIIIFLIWFIWVNYFNKPDKKEELSQ